MQMELQQLPESSYLNIDKVAEKIYFSSGKAFGGLDDCGVMRNDLAHLLLAG